MHDTLVSLAVRKLEQLGYMFAGDDWMHPVNHAAAIAPTITDELHAMLVKCADDLEGCASFPSDRIYVWPRRHLTAFVFEGNTDLLPAGQGTSRPIQSSDPARSEVCNRQPFHGMSGLLKTVVFALGEMLNVRSFLCAMRGRSRCTPP